MTESEAILAEKIARLPAWARERIQYLATRNEPAAAEIATLRNKLSHLQAQIRRKDEQIEAMVEMFCCAAKGGNEVAEAVKRIVEDFLVSDEE